jgi:hypothetical protein
MEVDDPMNGPPQSADVVMDTSPPQATSQLYQVQLKKTDVEYFKNPQNQPSTNPMNCGAVTAQLLGIVTPLQSEAMTSLTLGTFTSDWEGAFSRFGMMDTRGKRVAVTSYRMRNASQGIQTVERNLFRGFATPVLALRRTGVGHYFVVAKSKEDELYILDAQQRFVARGREVIGRYIHTNQLDGDFLVFQTDRELTPSDYISAYVSGPLAANLSYTISGGKKRRKTKRTRSHRRRITHGSHPR